MINKIIKNNFVKIIIILLVVIFISYIAGNIFSYVVNSKMKKIKIEISDDKTLEKFKNKINDSNNSLFDSIMIKKNVKNIKRKIETNLVEGYDNKESFKVVDPTIFVDKSNICCLNHKKCKSGDVVMCNYGLTNSAYPGDMSPIDKKIFMLNYSDNLTLQDYVNWLWCYTENREDLSYTHLKNLLKLERGEKLVYKKGVLPPLAKIQPPLTSKEYFEKLYNKDGNIQIAAPLHSTSGALLGYNYKEYPNIYDSLKQYGSTGRIFNINELKNKYDANFVSDIMTSRLTS